MNEKGVLPRLPHCPSVESRIARGREGAGSWGPLAARVGRNCRGHCGVGEPAAKLCGEGAGPRGPRGRRRGNRCAPGKRALGAVRPNPLVPRLGSDRGHRGVRGPGGEGYSGSRSKAGKEQKPEANFQDSSQSQEKMQTFSLPRTTSFSTLPSGLKLPSVATCWLSGHKCLLKTS